MRQIAYPAALGSCVLGAKIPVAEAAEWSITPSYSSAVDYDSNRRLLAETKGSDAAFVSIDLLFKKALENLQLTLEPRYTWRRYTDSSLGNGDDRTVNAGATWTTERALVNLTASYWDQSTLITELLETGIVSGDTHRRQTQAGASWNWSQTERRSLVTQINYSDVSYYGQAATVLTGYRYPSASLGERFVLDERSTFTVSAYGNILSSHTRGNSSHEYGLQGDLVHSFSERFNIDVSFGKSSRVLSGADSQGTVASLALNYLPSTLGKVTFSYTRSLVPYGFGFLVEQQQVNASYVQPLTPFLDSTLSFVRVQNNETAVQLRIDRANYNDLSAGLNWHLLETWSLAWRVDGIRTQVIGSGQSITSLRTAITLTWSPFPKARSW